jgi:hypothetical protein
MWLRTIALAAAAALMGVTDAISTQNASNSDNDQNKVVLTKLSAPVYPPRNAHQWERPVDSKVRQLIHSK